MKFDDFKMAGHDLYKLGFVDPIGGSLSIREADRVYITRQGAMLGHLKEDDIIEMSLNEINLLSGTASKDIAADIAIYKETGFNAVIHATPSYGVALSITTENKIMPQDADGQNQLRAIPVVRVRERGSSEELAKVLPPIYKSGYIVSIVKEYGSFSVGDTLIAALQNTVCLERSCKIVALNKMMVVPEPKKEYTQRERRSAIPPSIGVMDRDRNFKRGFNR